MAETIQERIARQRAAREARDAAARRPAKPVVAQKSNNDWEREYQLRREKEQKEAARRQARQLAALKRLAVTMPAPEGFTGGWTKDGWDGGETYVFANTDASVRFIFRPGGGGTTEFRLPDGSKRTFDRRGVSDSFYWGGWDADCTPKPLAEIKSDLADQLADVAKRLEFYKTAIAVPELGYTIAPETKALHIADLKAGRSISFMPSGFGTGYYVSRKRGRFDRPASVALSEFYGVGPLFISTFDAD